MHAADFLVRIGPARGLFLHARAVSILTNAFAGCSASLNVRLGWRSPAASRPARADERHSGGRNNRAVRSSEPSQGPQGRVRYLCLEPRTLAPKNIFSVRIVQCPRPGDHAPGAGNRDPALRRPRHRDNLRLARDGTPRRSGDLGPRLSTRDGLRPGLRDPRGPRQPGCRSPVSCCRSPIEGCIVKPENRRGKGELYWWVLLACLFAGVLVWRWQLVFLSLASLALTLYGFLGHSADASPSVRVEVAEYWLAAAAWLSALLLVWKRCIKALRPDTLPEEGVLLSSTVNRFRWFLPSLTLVLLTVAVSAPLLAPFDPSTQADLRKSRLLKPFSSGV